MIYSRLGFVFYLGSMTYNFLHYFLVLYGELTPPSSQNPIIVYEPQPRYQGSFLPVPTERERRVGERTWERGVIGPSSQISPLSLLTPPPPAPPNS